MSDETWRNLCQPWQNALIITLMGIRITHKILKDRLTLLWGTSDFELINLENNYLLVWRQQELPENPVWRSLAWVVQGHYLVVQRWSPHFDPYSHTLSKLAIWIRIPSLPMHCYTEDTLWTLGNIVGKTLKVDMNTLNKGQSADSKVEKGRYARISVEIDLRKSFTAGNGNEESGLSD